MSNTPKLNRRQAMAGVAAAASLLASPSWAQTYPSKQITLIVSYPAGGDTDALGRVLAEKLSARMGQTVVVDNKPGASGTIGNAMVAKAAPDGHTLLMTPSTIATALLVLKPGSGGSYDTVGDFAPVFLMGTQSLFLVVNTSTGISNMTEFVAAAKSGKIDTYATPGSGSPMHLLGEMFNKSAGVKLRQVPYRGSAPAVNDMLGGHINFMYTTLGPVNAHIASGKMRVLAVADAKRSTLAPNVPTLQESGLKDSDIGAWQAVLAPKGTPEAIIRTLNGHFNEIIKMPDVLARMNTAFTVPVGGEPQLAMRSLAGDNEKYGKVIKEFGIQAD
jgi:tripartite-type tricarboxylate transporter receptor subunit TctC